MEQVTPISTVVNAAATIAVKFGHKHVNVIDPRGFRECLIFCDQTLMIVYNSLDREVQVSEKDNQDWRVVMVYAQGKTWKFYPGFWEEHIFRDLLPEAEQS